MIFGRKQFNSSFPSCRKPPYQSEAWCSTIHMKTSFAWEWNLIFIWKNGHQNWLWERGSLRQFGNGLISTSFAMALFFSQVGDNSFDLPEANVLIQVRQVKNIYFTYTKIRIIHLDAIPLSYKVCFWIFVLRTSTLLRAYVLTPFKISSHGGSRRQVSVLYHLYSLFPWRIFSENQVFAVEQWRHNLWYTRSGRAIFWLVNRDREFSAKIYRKRSSFSRSK